MTEPLFVYLQNDLNGVVETYTPEAAQQFLDHPVFGQHLKVVRSAKPEVLASDAKAKESAKSDSDSKEK